jgi:cell division control protein 7
MAAAMHRPAEDTFDIHEDARTEDTEVMVDEEDVDGQDATTIGEPEEGEEEEEEEEVIEEVIEEEEEDESSEDEHVESSVQADMDRLQEDFPGFRDRYKLIKRIGEGMSLDWLYSKTPLG